MLFQACLIMSPASIAAEARILTRLSPPCPTAGCMVLCTYSFDFLHQLTDSATVANDSYVPCLLEEWSPVLGSDLAFFFLIGSYN